MKHKWMKILIIAVSALCVLVVLYVFALPIYVKSQIKNATTMTIGKWPDTTNTYQISDKQEIAELVECMNISNWKRATKNNPLDYDSTFEIYMTANDKYELYFTSYGEFGDVVIGLIDSKMPLWCIYRIEAEDYAEFENFYKTTIKE